MREKIVVFIFLKWIVVFYHVGYPIRRRQIDSLESSTRSHKDEQLGEKEGKGSNEQTEKRDRWDWDSMKTEESAEETKLEISSPISPFL